MHQYKHPRLFLEKEKWCWHVGILVVCLIYCYHCCWVRNSNLCHQCLQITTPESSEIMLQGHSSDFLLSLLLTPVPATGCTSEGFYKALMFWVRWCSVELLSWLTAIWEHSVAPGRHAPQVSRYVECVIMQELVQIMQRCSVIWKCTVQYSVDHFLRSKTFIFFSTDWLPVSTGFQWWNVTSTQVEYLYFIGISIFTSTPLHPRGKF